MSLLENLWERSILWAEDSSFGLNRWTGIAQYADPAKYLGSYLDGSRDELFAYCRRVEDDLFSYLRPADTLPPDVRVERVAAPGRAFRAAEAPYQNFSFASPLPSNVAPNDRVRVHRYGARRGAEGTILFHHPAFRTGLAWVRWFTRPLRERYDVVVLEIPYHLSRAPHGTFSGERLINPNPIHLYEGLRQWMADHRAVLALLDAKAAAGDRASRPVRGD